MRAPGVTAGFSRLARIGPTGFVVLALLAACGDDPPGPAGTGPGAAPQPAAAAFVLAGPADAVLDDEVVLQAVVASTRTGAPLPPELAKLPPRVSPARVGVRAVHDYLIAATESAADWPKLLDVLDELARGDRTKVDAGALASLVAAWRKWSPADRAAEAKLATRYTRALDLLRGQGSVDLVALDGATRDLAQAPPTSAAHASCLAVRAIHAALAAPGDEMPKAVAEPLRAATAAFDGIGWPGGAGPFLETAAAILEGRGKTTQRALTFNETAAEAYRKSGDPLRVALNRFERISLAERDGDYPRAMSLAETTVQEIEATGTRGRDLTRALFSLASMSLASGKPEASLAALERARTEIAYTNLDPAQMAPVGQKRATALWFLGRFDEAAAAADEGAQAFDANVKAPSPEQLALRAELDELAARSLVDGGHPAEGAARFRGAAGLHAKLPGGDRNAAVARLFAADALAKAGQRDAALKLIAEVLAGPDASYAVRANASSVLRELGDFEGAARELAAAEEAGVKAGGPGVREALVEERARLAAARKDIDGARTLFAAALQRATKGSNGNAAGFPASRVALDWARMEQNAGDVEEAQRLAGEAIGHLIGASCVVEVERARKVWTDCARQRLAFGDAEMAADMRVKSGPPGTAAMKLDAVLDLVLARIELYRSGREASKAKMDAAIALLPEGAVRTAAKAIAYDDASQPVGEVPGRAARLLDAAKTRGSSVEHLLALAARLPSDEPELRRWALRQVAAHPATDVAGVDWAAWLDRFRGAEPTTSTTLRASLGVQDRFVALEPLGTQTLVLVATPAGVSAKFVPGDAGLARWRDAVIDANDVRMSGDAGAVANGDAVVREALAPKAGQRLILSLARPFGPLPGDMMTTRTEAGATQFLDQWEVDWVRSPSELVTAAGRSQSPALPMLLSPDSALRTRHAIVPIFPVDDVVRARFAALVEEERAKGLDASAAVRSAKLRLRAEWKSDPKRPSVPAWACFVLRGAP